MVSFVAVVGLLSVWCYTAQSATISKKLPFNAAVQQHAVDAHNNLRSQIATGNLSGQPAASNMQALLWDADLAGKAQAWAEKCNFEHSNGTKVLGYRWVGENLAVGTMSAAIANDEDLKKRFTAGFKGWADEASQFSFPQTCKKSPCGHYTQLVWAKTRKFGCGLAQCNGMDSWSSAGNKLTYLLVCNYGPGGNWNSEDPYVKGTACGACPKEASTCTANKLCN